jgi:hypothetical protein
MDVQAIGVVATAFLLGALIPYGINRFLSKKKKKPARRRRYARRNVHHYFPENPDD